MTLQAIINQLKTITKWSELIKLKCKLRSDNTKRAALELCTVDHYLRQKELQFLRNGKNDLTM